MHTIKEWLKAIKMCESGLPVRHVAMSAGIEEHELDLKWRSYRLKGMSGIMPRPQRHYDAEFKISVVRCYLEECLSLNEVAAQYGVSRDCVKEWTRKVRKEGYAGLQPATRKETSDKPTMGRPKKKPAEQMTELERLRQENQDLKTQIALLKKVRALVEERNARLRATGQEPSKG